MIETEFRRVFDLIRNNAMTLDEFSEWAEDRNYISYAEGVAAGREAEWEIAAMYCPDY